MTSLEPATQGRVLFSKVGEDLRIQIPIKKSPLLIVFIIFMSFFLAGWIRVMIPLAQLASLIYFEDGPAFLRVLFALWSILGLIVLTLLLRSLWGREIVTVNTEFLIKELSLFGLGKKRRYRTLEIVHFRVVPGESGAFVFQSPIHLLGYGGGTIAFDYREKTIRFGGLLNVAEAQYLVDRIKEHSGIKD